MTMNKNKSQIEQTENTVKSSEVLSQSYKRPELKKQGKLKNTASQSVSTYTYTTVL